MNESIPSSTQPPHAARKPRLWLVVRGTRDIKLALSSAPKSKPRKRNEQTLTVGKGERLIRQRWRLWNPTTYCLCVICVRVAELSSQRGFFVQHHEQIRQQEENRGLDQY